MTGEISKFIANELGLEFNEAKALAKGLLLGRQAQEMSEARQLRSSIDAAIDYADAIPVDIAIDGNGNRMVVIGFDDDSGDLFDPGGLDDEVEEEI